jgi:hypothetical protein
VDICPYPKSKKLVSTKGVTFFRFGPRATDARQKNGSYFKFPQAFFSFPRTEEKRKPKLEVQQLL